MATNVTERNKTLNEIIEWCETRISTINVDYTETAADVLVFLGERQALGDVADHCRSMLGYSGSMPSDVPNQSEDAKNEMETGLVGHRRKPADRTDGGGCGRNIHCLLRLHMGRSDNRQNHHHARRKSIIRLHGQRHKPGPT